MSDRTHALLNPSGGERWMRCSPSARLTEHIADEDSDYAKEGTLAHSLWETFLKDKLGIWNPLQVVRQLEKIQSDRLYHKDMTKYAYEFSAYVLEVYNFYKAKDPTTVLIIEEEIDLSAFIPEGRGHVDIAIVTKDKIIAIDFKYGQGVWVSAKDNTQLKIYALGVLDKYLLDRDIEEIELTVYQPRLDNIDTDVIDIQTFTSWVSEVLQPAAQKAWKGDGEQVAGSHCKFCKIRSTCRANADFNLQLADLAFQEIYTLTDEEIKDILGKVDMLTAWAGDVKAYALSEAIKGRKWEGLKLVEGRSNRKFKSEAKVVKMLTDNGFPEERIYNKTIKNFTEFQAELGKKYFDTLFKGFIIKPQGKPTLVPLSDRREEFKLQRSAEEDFKDLDIDDDILSML